MKFLQNVIHDRSHGPKLCASHVPSWVTKAIRSPVMMNLIAFTANHDHHYCQISHGSNGYIFSFMQLYDNRWNISHINDEPLIELCSSFFWTSDRSSAHFFSNHCVTILRTTTRRVTHKEQLLSWTIPTKLWPTNHHYSNDIINYISYITIFINHDEAIIMNYLHLLTIISD